MLTKLNKRGGANHLTASHSVDLNLIESLKILSKVLLPFRGFTLAEVLITIGILGIVAAMTIPTLMQNSQNRELVSQYLKMNNVLSNALKNMEAYEQTKINKMNETDFKTKFENHLKTISCNSTSDFTPDVCLQDGGQIKYGTFDTTCTNDICMQLTIDTNGDKKPNQAGKDRFTVNLTKLGLKATGDSDTCSEGYDCGAYILAHHKLWNGETGSNTVEDTRTVAEKNQEALAACKSSNATSCTLANGLQLTKEGDLWTSPTLKGANVSEGETPAWEPADGDYPSDGDNECYNPQTDDWEEAADGMCHGGDYWGGAKKYCEDQGLTLPTRSQLQTLRTTRGCKSSSTSPECSGWFLSSELNSDHGYAYNVYFQDGYEVTYSRSYIGANFRVVCGGN